MLGLLHLYHLHQAHEDKARALYDLSRDTVQEFPLAVVSLNVTLWTIQVCVRDGGRGEAAGGEHSPLGIATYIML